MAEEKQTALYTITSVVLSPGPANSVLAQINFEGAAQGLGKILATETFVVGKSTTYSQCAMVYADNGDILTYTSQGTYEIIGPFKWRRQGVGRVSDSRTLAVGGEMDLIARTFTSKYSSND
jgi:hypothetical protein